MIKALRVTTEGHVQEIDLAEDSLRKLQTAVGGYVQAVNLTDTLTLWCNEDGKLQRLRHNPYAQRAWDASFGAHTDYIVGDVVFTSDGPDGQTASIEAEDEAAVRAIVEAVAKVVSPSFGIV